MISMRKIFDVCGNPIEKLQVAPSKKDSFERSLDEVRTLLSRSDEFFDCYTVQSVPIISNGCHGKDRGKMQKIRRKHTFTHRLKQIGNAPTTNKRIGCGVELDST